MDEMGSCEKNKRFGWKSLEDAWSRFDVYNAIIMCALLGPGCLLILGGTIGVFVPQMLDHFRDVRYSHFLVPQLVTMPSLVIPFTAPIVGKLSDHIGRSELFLIAIFMSGVLGCMPMLVNNLYLILVLRALYGIPLGAITTLVVAQVADRTFGPKRNRWMSIYAAIVQAYGMFVFTFYALIPLVYDNWKIGFLLYGSAFVFLPSSIFLVCDDRRSKIRGIRRKLVSGSSTRSSIDEIPELELYSSLSSTMDSENSENELHSRDDEIDSISSMSGSISNHNKCDSSDELIGNDDYGYDDGEGERIEKGNDTELERAHAPLPFRKLFPRQIAFLGNIFVFNFTFFILPITIPVYTSMSIHPGRFASTMASLYLMISVFGGLLSAILFPFFKTKFSPSFPTILVLVNVMSSVGLWCIACAVIFVSWSTLVAGALISFGIFVMGAAIGFMFPTQGIWITYRVPEHRRGFWSGMATVMQYMGQFCTPFCASWVYHGFFDGRKPAGVFWVFGCVIFILSVVPWGFVALKNHMEWRRERIK